MKYSVLIIVCILFPIVVFSQNWVRIGRHVKAVQKEQCGNDRVYQSCITVLDKARRHYHVWEELNIDFNNDTIFILDYPRIGEEHCFSQIWNNRKYVVELDVVLVYKFKGERCELDIPRTLMDGIKKNVLNIEETGINSSLIDGYTEIDYKDLAEAWNIPAIRFGEKYGGHAMQEQSVYLTRIIFNKGKEHCDCIVFRDFMHISNEYIGRFRKILNELFSL